ncbi:MAG: electron transfer flavoprotein subunit beta/FixA family protein [Calditrichaeota bacterium]|nr:MAG: electron transfer flavoprotein subunit beta/FixA family protein [Calditrichota bacterium]
MNIVVLLRQVPDLVEELELDESGKDLNRDWLKYKINEFDDHALEEALLLKEESGATVTAVALESEDIDKALYTAAAKGADRLIKVTGDFGPGVPAHVAAKAFANALQSVEYDLILTGVQAVDERDGQVAVLLAHYLDVPHVSVVTGVSLSDGAATVQKEYAGGLMAEFEVRLPAVLGIQAARQTPRYAPVSRVRQAMRSTELEEVAAGDAAVPVGSAVERMFKPETGAGAEMLEGSAEEVAEKIVNILKERGIKK